MRVFLIKAAAILYIITGIAFVFWALYPDPHPQPSEETKLCIKKAIARYGNHEKQLKGDKVWIRMPGGWKMICEERWGK